MTQIWPGFGEAPVPILVSMIFSPDGVVMGVPAVCAAAGAKLAAVNVRATPAMAVVKATATAIPVLAPARGKTRILSFSWRSMGQLVRGNCVANVVYELCAEVG